MHLFHFIRGRLLICLEVKLFKPAVIMLLDSWRLSLLEGNETKLLIIVCNSQLKTNLNFNNLNLNSAVFSGMRGGIFMCALSRLNKRLKHLLFYSLLQQEVHFFQENNPGEAKIFNKHYSPRYLAASLCL